MNKKKLAVLAAIAMSFTAMPVFAQEAGGGSAMNMAPAGQDQDAGPGQGQGGQELSQQKFEALKAVVLSRMKQKEACVAAAADAQALRDCMMPNGAGAAGGDGGGHMMMHSGHPMQRGGMGGINPGADGGNSGSPSPQGGAQ